MVANKDTYKILVVEDSERLNSYISTLLEKQGWQVVQKFDGKTAYTALKNDFFDLVVLDINLGDISGLNILHTIRLQDKTIPVMIISSICDEATKIEGFRQGCDDYLTKPFMSTEMIMRAKRMLERSFSVGQKENISKTVICDNIEAGPFEIEIASQKVLKNGVEIQMRKKYFEIFLYLVQHPDVVIPAKMLYQQVWQKEPESLNSIESNLYVNIRNLRILIEDDPQCPKYIKTSHSSGYVFTVK